MIIFRNYKCFVLLTFLLIMQNALSFTITTSIKKPNHSLVIQNDKALSTYTPNSNLHIGFKIIGDYIFFQYSFKIPNKLIGASRKDNEHYQDARLGLYFSNKLFEVFYKRYKGFDSNENGGAAGCNDCLKRNALTSQELLFQAIVATESDFKIRNVISGARDTVSSEWSPVFVLMANELKIKDPGGIAQGQFLTNNNIFQDLTKIVLKQYGAGLGVAVTYPMGTYLYIGALTSFSMGLQKNELIYLTSKKTIDEFGFNYNLRFLLGTHNKKYNFGMRGTVVSNYFDIGDRVSATSVNYELRLFMSMVF